MTVIFVEFIMRHQKAIHEFRSRLQREYGDAIVRLLVFGSVARGTDSPESDIDVMIVVNADRLSVDWELERCLRGVALDVELMADVVFDLKVVAQQDWSGLRGHTPFMERVAEEGIAV